MTTVRTPAGSERPLVSHVRGHLLLFDGRRAPAYGAATAARLLLGAVLLEIVRVAGVRWLYPGIPFWALMPALLGLAALVATAAGLTMAQFGLLRWRAWTVTEKSYIVQIFVLVNAVFPALLAAPLGARLATLGPLWSLWHVFVPYFLFGFYQELVYRGMIQLELARRWGAPAGIFVANVLYTFGPLHAGYVSSGSWPMLASIFVAGLFFGVLYWRSGNLWLPGIFHGIGNAYVAGILGPVP